MIITFQASLYDGRQSVSHSVAVSVNEDGLLTVDGFEVTPQPFAGISVSERISNTPRFLDLGEGIRIETRDNDAIDQLLSQWQTHRTGLAHVLESNYRVVLVALFLLVIGAFFLVRDGIPAMSGQITALLPEAVDDQLGVEVLEQLDSFVFETSEIPSQQQARLRQYFASLTPDSDRNYQLRFRSSEALGANAFALPNAEIVFTDQLIDLASEDEMLGAIMLHEIGHVVHRHTMRAVISQAGVSMLVFGLTGDVSGAATALLVLLPNFLIQSSYSRDMEWEADGYALEQMQLRGMDPNDFAAMMERIVTSDADIDGAGTESTQSQETGLAQYFSSHPATRERIARFREAARSVP